MSLKIKLIATDFDGTIFQENETPPIPVELQTQINFLRSRGCKWVICTGRDLRFILDGLAAAKLHLYPDFLVTVEREIYFRNGCSYKPLIQWNDRCKQIHDELFTKVYPFVPELMNALNEKFNARTFSDDFSPLCIIAPDNNTMDKICAYLLEFCKTIPGLDLMRNDVYARFCHRDFNKGTTITEISRFLGLQADSVFAAGDQINDLPMLDKNVANYITAPSNAVDVVKYAVIQQNGYLSSKPAGAGVLDGLRFYLNS